MRWVVQDPTQSKYETAARRPSESAWTGQKALSGQLQLDHSKSNKSAERLELSEMLLKATVMRKVVATRTALFENGDESCDESGQPYVLRRWRPRRGRAEDQDEDE